MRGTRRLILLAAASTIVLGLLAAAPAYGAGKEKTLYSFCSRPDCADGAIIFQAGLVFDAAGNLYGTTVAGGRGCATNVPPGCGTAFRLAPGADGRWAETVLHKFCEDGCTTQPIPSSLAFDLAGNLYGVFNGGGPDYCSLFEEPCGQVFELMPSESGPWGEKILFGFVGKLGWGPFGGLILDSAGNLYGATFSGGYGDCDEVGDGCGTVFEASPRENGRWAVKFPYAFDGSDGAVPVGSLLFDAAGNLYGSSQYGGPTQDCSEPYLGCGTVFKLTRGEGGTWTLRNLHYFGGGKYGSVPNGNLIVDSAGNLYGTTQFGGSGNCPHGGYFPGCGVVFELIHAGGKWTYKVLHEFENNGRDGYYPYGGLVFDKAGNLYGTTSSGGAGGASCFANYDGCGVVFEVTPGTNGKWTERIVHSFKNDGKDGIEPMAGLVIDGAGNLYGTTYVGGDAGYGTVFEITP